jgi:hypothetical protein
MKVIPKFLLIFIALAVVIGAYYLQGTNKSISPIFDDDANDVQYESSQFASNPMPNYSQLVIPKYFSLVNVKHVLEGGINRRGEATGFHHLPSKKQERTKILEIINKANSCGVYRAKVQIDGKVKKAFSTMFPDRLTSQEVINSIKAGYEKAQSQSITRRTIQISTNECYDITIILDDNKNIITSYPMFKN